MKLNAILLSAAMAAGGQAAHRPDRPGPPGGAPGAGPAPIVTKD